MKPYTVAIEIELPRDKVIELFDNPENQFHWQNGLVDVTHLDGEPGQPGATTRLTYVMGSHRIELTETVTVRNFPDSFEGRYEWSGGSNTLKNRFIVINQSKTLWESTCAYKMKSLPNKLMAFFMPGKFKEQNMKFLRNFKAFAETGVSVNGQ